MGENPHLAVSDGGLDALLHELEPPLDRDTGELVFAFHGTGFRKADAGSQAMLTFLQVLAVWVFTVFWVGHYEASCASLLRFVAGFSFNAFIS